MKHEQVSKAGQALSGRRRLRVFERERENCVCVCMPPRRCTPRPRRTPPLATSKAYSAALRTASQGMLLLLLLI
jgi:hypothetical protein